MKTIFRYIGYVLGIIAMILFALGMFWLDMWKPDWLRAIFP